MVLELRPAHDPAKACGVRRCGDQREGLLGHCDNRSDLARSAHGGQMLARIAPYGIMIVPGRPVTTSVRRN